MLHKDIPVGADSSHPPGYVQAGDPGAVGAFKVWIDTTLGTGLWVKKIRNAANSGWEAVGAGASALNDLSDVDTSGQTAGDVLAYDGADWIPTDLGVIPVDLDDLSDVDTTGVGSGDVLTYDGADWIAQAPTGGGSSLPIDAAAVASVGSGDLFPGTSLDGGWSDLQATPNTSKDRSVDGFLILKNSGATAERRGVKRAFAPAGDFQVYANLLSATWGYNVNYCGVFIGSTDPSDAGGGSRLGLNLGYNAGNVFLYGYKMIAGVESNFHANNLDNASLGAATRLAAGAYTFPAWLRIKRVGATVSIGVCWDGVQFIDLAATTTIAFTVDTIGLEDGQNTDTRANQAVFKYIATVG